jgi:uncharacterized membrane protein
LSANWELIPRELRMGGLIAITLGINLLGLRHFLADRVKAATLAFLLGSIMYGASIMLIAQIYHLGEHFPDGIYWWALGALPSALLLQSRLLMALVIALATTWFFVESDMGFYPASYPLFLCALGWLVLLRKQSLLLFLVLVAAIGLWLEYTLAWWLADGWGFEFSGLNVTLTAGLMILLFALGHWLLSVTNENWRDYGTLLDIWVIRLALILLLVMSFDRVWPDVMADLQQARWWNTSLVLLAAIGAALLNALTPAPRLSVWFFAVMYALLFLVAAWIDTSQALALQVIDNLLLVGIGIWLIQSGIARRVSHYFYLGVAAVLITGLVRYIDLIGDYVGAAVLFIVFALILLASARYWRTMESGGKK